MSQSRKFYYIQEHLHRRVQHGGIGNIDIERILIQNKFIPIVFPGQDDFSFVNKIRRLLYLLKIIFNLKRNSVVFYQFPLYARMHQLLVRALPLKGVKLICFIIDINGLKDGDPKVLRQELRELKRNRYFIVHNEKMKAWLKERVPGAKVSTIGFFDFLAQPFYNERSMEPVIVFAGNLEKSGFLNRLNEIEHSSPFISFHLYGPGISEKVAQQQNVVYKGSFDPYKLPAKLEGSFGLIWDGDGIHGPEGSLGHYMNVISHHKLSLYIVSGLPLIVPAFSASAPMVMNYGIGILINDLNEISNAIDSVTMVDYARMRQNLIPLSRRITEGLNTKEAVDNLVRGF